MMKLNRWRDIRIQVRNKFTKTIVDEPTEGVKTLLSVQN